MTKQKPLSLPHMAVLFGKFQQIYTNLDISCRPIQPSKVWVMLKTELRKGKYD